MYKLTIEFKNNDELAAFVIKLGGVPAGALVQQTMPVSVESAPTEAPSVKEEKPKKAKAKKETVVDQGEEVDVPPVIETKAPAIDRDAVIATVSKNIAELSELGMKGGDIAAALADIYVRTNCPAGVKISQLDDNQLAQFFPSFTAFVAKAKGLQVATTQTQSFV